MNVCIVGGGITGITAGYELVKKGHNVMIFEKEENYGGLVDTCVINGEPLERCYHHIFTSDEEIISLIHELGLDSDLKWYEPNNSIYINDVIHPFTSPVDLLKFNELSLKDRVRMGLMVLRAGFIKNWQDMEHMTAKEWIIKNAGNKVYDKVWGPLIYSKFDIDAEDISAVWIWNKFKLRGRTRGNNAGREMLGYMDGSFRKLLDKMVMKITESRGAVKTNMPVSRITPLKSGGFEVKAGETVQKFDAVIVTVFPGMLYDLLPEMPENYMEKVLKIRYKANICVMLELSKRISPWYWVTIAEEGFPFVLAIEHTNLITDWRYKSSILYLSRYLDANSELYKMSDDEIISTFLTGAKKIFPDMDESLIKNVHISKFTYSQPVVTKKYSTVLPALETPIPGLYLSCMAQIYPEDRGQNYAVRMGKTIAGRIG